MKNRIILIGYMMIALFISDIQAQQLHNNIYVNDAKAYQVGDSLIIEMAIDGRKARLKSNESVILIPVVRTDNNMRELHPVVISGNTRYKADKRSLFFNRNNSERYAAIPLRTKGLSSVDYKQNIIYEEWMQNASVFMKQSVIGCAECSVSENWDIIGNEIRREMTEIEKPDIKFVVSYITPKAEAVKNRDYEGSAFLDFQVGKSVIIPDFRNNYKELNKIEEVLNQLKTDNNATIQAIALVGFASPEGSFQTNSRLSSSRAQALKLYLQRKYNYNDAVFKVEQGGEDWSGLEKIVSESYLSDKNKILDIINSPLSEDIKEQRLKALGSTYSILLEEYFPKLRRVDYKLNYIVRAFSVEEGRSIVKINPGQMSLNEMFLVANSYEKGSKDFKDIFDIAVRMYPKDIVANINAAAIALEDNNIREAHKYLDSYQDIPESWNNQGILYAIEGDFDKAKEFFKKARNIGTVEAIENLNKISLMGNLNEK